MQSIFIPSADTQFQVEGPLHRGRKIHEWEKAHLQSLNFPSMSLVWGKLFPVGCAQDS